MANNVALHPQLQKDCFEFGSLSLCRLLLMNDSQFPWYILVPQRADVTEIFQLSVADQRQLIFESSLLAESLNELYRPDKLNIAAIGNLVPQLHIHHIVRYRHDKAWPTPVWGKFENIPYNEWQVKEHCQRIATRLADYLVLKK